MLVPDFSRFRLNVNKSQFLRSEKMNETKKENDTFKCKKVPNEWVMTNETVSASNTTLDDLFQILNENV